MFNCNNRRLSVVFNQRKEFGNKRSKLWQCFDEIVIHFTKIMRIKWGNVKNDIWCLLSAIW